MYLEAKYFYLLNIPAPFPLAFPSSTKQLNKQTIISINTPKTSSEATVLVRWAQQRQQKTSDSLFRNKICRRK